MLTHISFWNMLVDICIRLRMMNAVQRSKSPLAGLSPKDRRHWPNNAGHPSRMWIYCSTIIIRNSLNIHVVMKKHVKIYVKATLLAKNQELVPFVKFKKVFLKYFYDNFIVKISFFFCCCCSLTQFHCFRSYQPTVSVSYAVVDQTLFRNKRFGLCLPYEMTQ